MKRSLPAESQAIDRAAIVTAREYASKSAVKLGEWLEEHQMRDVIVSDTYTHLLQPDTLLPSQYFAALRRKGAHEPERRLAIAVLQDAVDCFQKHLRARDRKARQLFLDAEEWICSEDRSWPFSFENICDLLQINAEYLRRGLSTWKDQQINGQLRGKVVTLKPLLSLDDQDTEHRKTAHAR